MTVPVNIVELKKLLRDFALNEETISYSDLCDALGLPPPNGRWKSHPLAIALAALDEEDLRSNLGRRATVVVRKGKKDPSGKERKVGRIPGDGYFKPYISSDGEKLDTSRKREIFDAEFRRLIDRYTSGQ
jgi:hypothetical protein